MSTRRDFLGHALAGLGAAVLGRWSPASARSLGDELRRGGPEAGGHPPPLAGSWLSHPPYRPQPAASSRPLDEARRVYFVAPDGSDTNGDGSEGRPWRSWGPAGSRLAPGDTLCMRGGVHFMDGDSVWLVSGTSSRPITIRAYPGELPIVTTAYPEFYRDPGSAWEPVPSAAGGADLEFRSRRTYALSSPIVRGRFADSFYPLLAYVRESDFRSENEVRLSEVGKNEEYPIGLWAGPGARWSSDDGRIHVRLRHTNRWWLDHEDYLGIGGDFTTNNYRGLTDPREMPLLLVGDGANRSLIRVAADHVRVFDLVFSDGLEVEGGDLHFENVWSFTGNDSALLSRASRTRYTRCIFRGMEAPWNNRYSSKYRSVPLYTVHLPAGTDLEIDHCEVTDGHDAILCTNAEAQNLDFHHNLVERNSDDGLFLPPKQASIKRIYQNVFRMNLSHLPFRDGTPVEERPGDGTYVCRNLFDMRPMTPGSPQLEGAAEPNEYYEGYNLRMEHADVVTYPGLYFYHNTVLARRSQRTYGQGITEKYDQSIRRVFNNIFGQTANRPQQTVRRSNGDLEFGYNLQWSLTVGSGGTWPGDVHADPRFVKWTPDWRDPDDFHLLPDSPARGRGTTIPTEWFDPLRDLDSQHDIGAIPFGVSGTPFGPGADL